MNRREAGGARARRGASRPQTLILRSKVPNPHGDSLSGDLAPQQTMRGCDLCGEGGCDSRPGCRAALLALFIGGRNAKSTP